ncbi:MAG: hypothetical protein OHK0017_11030 [Patescibacteria group bacterium]
MWPLASATKKKQIRIFALSECLYQGVELIQALARQHQVEDDLQLERLYPEKVEILNADVDLDGASAHNDPKTNTLRFKESHFNHVIPKIVTDLLEENSITARPLIIENLWNDMCLLRVSLHELYHRSIYDANAKRENKSLTFRAAVESLDYQNSSGVEMSRNLDYDSTEEALVEFMCNLQAVQKFKELEDAYVNEIGEVLKDVKLAKKVYETLLEILPHYANSTKYNNYNKAFQKILTDLEEKSGLSLDNLISLAQKTMFNSSNRDFLDLFIKHFDKPYFYVLDEYLAKK